MKETRYFCPNCGTELKQGECYFDERMGFVLGEYSRFRSECHKVKVGNKDSIEMTAHLLSKYICENDVLVPMPSHYGYATYTKEIATIISQIKGSPVEDCLRCVPHNILYQAKKSGEKINIEMFSLYVPFGNIILIDNVIDTGLTMDCAMEAMGVECGFAAIGITTNSNYIKKI